MIWVVPGIKRTNIIGEEFFDNIPAPAVKGERFMRALGSFQLASTANRVIQATKANAGNPWMQKGIPGLASHRRDQATISDRGRTLNAIQELNKQKTTLKDNRRALIADTLEQGKSLDEIEGQLDSYDEQLQTLEQQISDLTARLSEPETTKKEEKKSPETEEEAQKQQMGDLADSPLVGTVWENWIPSAPVWMGIVLFWNRKSNWTSSMPHRVGTATAHRQGGAAQHPPQPFLPALPADWQGTRGDHPSG